MADIRLMTVTLITSVDQAAQTLLGAYSSSMYTTISLSNNDWAGRPGTTGTTGQDTFSGTPAKADDCDHDSDDRIIITPDSTRKDTVIIV
jgi:hypothetical protein